MNIVIIANFPSDLGGGLMGRFINLAMLLHQRGHEVEVIVSDFEHGSKKHREIMDNKYPFKLTYLHEPGYPGNISLKRLWSHYIWGCNVGKYLESLKQCPDVIYCAIPSITAGYKAAKFARKRDLKFITDIQDLWPEAFCMVIKNKLLQLAFKPMEWYVNKVYASADVMVAVSDTYVDRGLSVNKRSKKGLCVFLGNDGEKFDKGRDSYIYQRPEDEIWLAYVGTLGYSYDIPCVIDAVAMAQQELGNSIKLKFVIMGHGPLQQKFEQYAMERNVNCVFTGRLDYSNMVGLMCSCDIVVNPIKKGSAASIINKVGDYALSGLPVINTQESLEYRALIDEYGCGINCEVENSVQVADAIITLVKDGELRKKMGKASRRLGVERFDRRYTYPKIVKLFE